MWFGLMDLINLVFKMHVEPSNESWVGHKINHYDLVHILVFFFNGLFLQKNTSGQWEIEFSSFRVFGNLLGWASSSLLP